MFELVAACVLFAAWLAITLANAVGRSERVVKHLGVFGQLLPVWNFFAPRPNTYDQFLLYRDELSDGSVTAWRETHTPRYGRGVSRALWNPRKFEAKAFIDIVQSLLGEAHMIASPTEQPVITLSIPYLLLLNRVVALPHYPGARLTQFAIMQRDRQNDSTIATFVSRRHVLDLVELVHVAA